MEDTQTEIRTTIVGDKTIISPDTSITYQNYQKIETAFYALAKRGIVGIVLDLREVPFLDSKAMELLVEIQKYLNTHGSELILMDINDVCRDILISTRLVSRLKIITRKDLR